MEGGDSSPDGSDSGPDGGEEEEGDTGGLSCDLDEVFSSYACTSCHDATPGLEGGNLDLLSPGLADRLVNQPSLNSGCAGELLVNGSEPKASVFLKALDPDRYADYGSESCQPPRMPLGSQTHVSDAHVDCLEEWVESLADGGGPEPAPFDPASLESSVAKVKYLLNGGAVTEADLLAASDEEGNLDEEKLRDLIDEWIWSAPDQLNPDFDVKLRMFLGLALQQRNIKKSSTFRYQDQLDLKPKNLPLEVDKGTFSENAEIMFIDTARDIVAEDRDFREVVTTRRWKVNTATLAGLVHADHPDLVNEKNRIDDVDKFGVFGHLEPGDYSDWRYVTIEQATQGNPPQLVYENTAEFAEAVRSIGEGGSVRLWTPRVGFFNTLVFFDQWKTNQDNDFRITTSQPVIAALDLIFEAGDPTEPASLEGLAAEHAEEGTACYGCHQFIDPMRTIYGSYYDHRNRSKGPRDPVEASFAFHGHVVDPITSMDGLAQAFVDHPRFAAAWTQKVCMWANSQRCDENDPVFEDVAATFRDGYTGSEDDDYRLDILFREFFSSTLATGATPSPAHEVVEFIVSPTRVSHFCQATNVRLRQAGELRCAEEGIDDAEQCASQPRNCFAQWKIGESLGQDNYIRGAREFSTPSSQDPMYAISVRQTCRDVAKVVSAQGPISKDDPPANTIRRLVKTLMGLPESHPRHELSYEALLRNYQILREGDECPDGENYVTANEGIEIGGDFVCGPGLNGNQAMQQVVTMACETPELSGMGF